MHKLTALSTWTTSRGQVIAVNSPVTAPRDGPEIRELLRVVEIDGIVRHVIGVEMHMPNTPIKVGEVIGLLIASESPATPADNPPE